MTAMTTQTSSGSIDLLVRGGTLIDGTGALPVQGDLAISGGMSYRGRGSH